MASMKSKKGILLTLGLVFVSLTVLSFAGVILNNSETSENRIKEFIETERMYNLDKSISKSISRLNDALGRDVFNASWKNNTISIDALFSNESLKEQNEIRRQLNIFNSRLKESGGYINFTNFPIFGESDVISGGNSNPVTSSRFYLKNSPNMYIEYVAHPYNMIYLNGFNNTNTERINFTYVYGNHMFPFAVEELSGGIPTANCVTSGECVEIYFETRGNAQSISSLFEFDNMGSYTASNTKMYRQHVSDSSWGTYGVDNRTIAFNWLVLAASPTNEKTTKGLAIVLPEKDQAGTFFGSTYYGYAEGTNSLLAETRIELEITLRGDVLKHREGFMSPPVYDIVFPHLETSANDLKVYFEQ